MISSGVKGWIKQTTHPLRISVLVVLSFAFRSTAITVSPSTITLAWDPSSDPSVVGYNLYYGTATRSYANEIAAGTQTSLTISNLVPGTTYYFAATTFNAGGLESDYSAEATYTVPIQNQPPTLDPIADWIAREGAGLQTINLTGISSGSPNELQTLTVTAFSSNPGLVPNPTIDYTSPNATGVLTFTPVAGSSGSATVTVMVDDGATVSNTIMRSFVVTIYPVNNPPTLDPMNDLVINQNAGLQTVPLSGITTGSPTEIQTLSILASSSNQGLIPTPVINYTSPNAAGTLTFTPVTNAFGSSTITVTVNDGQPTNSTVTQTFVVTVNQTVVAQATLTNAVVAPNTLFQFVLSPPDNSGHKFNYSLGTDAPPGVTLVTRKGVGSVLWTPTFSQASTTNLFTVQATDRTTSLSTNQSIRVTVLDYLSVRGGSTSVQAGQSAVLPLFLSSSDGVTNVTFTVDWSSSRFASPSLSAVASGIATSSLQNQGTNLLINFQSASGQPLQGSNLLGQITFQTSSNQASAFVSLPVRIVSAIKPNATSYSNYVPTPGQVVVVNDLPLLQASAATYANRGVTVFGRVGTTYQLQSSTNVSGTWIKVLNYKQTSVAQNLDVSGTAPVVFYRILQQ